MAQGSGKIYSTHDISAIMTKGAVYNNQRGNQEQDQRGRKNKDDFAEVYEAEQMRGQPTEDINIQTRGYTKTGALTLMNLKQHDYTFQMKTC